MRNRKNQILSIVIASMATMLASGFWHGAGITFIIWGFLHGLLISIPPLVNNLQQNRSKDHFPQLEKIRVLVKIVLTFGVISFSWIFFRANTLSDAFFMITNIFRAINPVSLPSILHGQIADVVLLFTTDKVSRVQELVLPVFILMVLGVEYLRERGDFLKNLSVKPLVLRWSLYVLLITSLMLFGSHGFEKPSQFIYFRF